MAKKSSTILKELFEGQEGAYFYDNQQQQKICLQTVFEQLKKNDRYNVNMSKGYATDVGNYESINVYSKRRLDYYYDNCTLMFNKQNKLSIGWYHDGYPINSLNDIDRYFDKLQEEFDKKEAVKQKRQKINQLKTNAIAGKVQEIANEDKFEYNIQQDSVKVKLFIKLKSPVALQIDIPFSKFQKVLPQIRNTVKTIRELYESGITFKIKSQSYMNWNGPN